MFAIGFIISVVSLISFLIALVWLIVAVVTENTASRRNALKLLAFSALGLLVSFPLCTMGFGNVNFH
jgi:hypothetical protein